MKALLAESQSFSIPARPNLPISPRASDGALSAAIGGAMPSVKAPRGMSLDVVESSTDETKLAESAIVEEAAELVDGDATGVSGGDTSVSLDGDDL